MALLDSTVVNVALPTIGRHLNASLGDLQWTVTAYTLTLAGLILVGGSLGDRLGRRRIFVIGARVLQGIGGALLTPGSLAIIQATFHPDDRPRAVGAWSGLGGVASAIGPVLGGWLVQVAGWRWVFLLNLPLAAAVVLVSIRHVPETRDSSATGRFDVAGAALAALGLGGITYWLIEAPEQPGSAAPLVAGVIGVAAFAGFLVTEHRRTHNRRVPAMMPLDVFGNRQFSVINAIK